MQVNATFAPQSKSPEYTLVPDKPLGPVAPEHDWPLHCTRHMVVKARSVTLICSPSKAAEFDFTPAPLVLRIGSQYDRVGPFGRIYTFALSGTALPQVAAHFWALADVPSDQPIPLERPIPWVNWRLRLKLGPVPTWDEQLAVLQAQIVEFLLMPLVPYAEVDVQEPMMEPPLPYGFYRPHVPAPTPNQPPPGRMFRSAPSKPQSGAITKPHRG